MLGNLIYLQDMINTKLGLDQDNMFYLF